MTPLLKFVLPSVVGCASEGPRSRALTLQQLRQLGDVAGDAPRLIAGQLLKRIPRGALAFVIDEGERLPLVVADAEAVGDFVHGPGRWETAGRRSSYRPRPQRLAVRRRHWRLSAYAAVRPERACASAAA
jgi:hypothetical protein